jgi:hypothetical protein
MEEEKRAHAGSFCWNEACADSGQVGKGPLLKNGKTDKRVPRYRSHTWKQTFTQTKATLFYRCPHSQEERVQGLARGGERASLAALPRMKGIKEESVGRGMPRAATPVEQVEEQLVGPKKLSRAPRDALWTALGPQGEKGGSQKKREEERVGQAAPSTCRPVSGEGEPEPRPKKKSRQSLCNRSKGRHPKSLLRPCPPMEKGPIAKPCE